MSESRLIARRWPQQQDREPRETTQHELRQPSQRRGEAGRSPHLILVPGPDTAPVAVAPAPAPAPAEPPHQIERLVARFGGRHVLSARQTEMIQMAIAGVHRKEIAARMGCSLKTIEGYWKRIHEKTACTSDAEVVARFIREALSIALAGRKAERLTEGNFPSCADEAASVG
jgi:DNA-binding CsgD family transcriptional regulator